MAPINIRGNILDPSNLAEAGVPSDASETDYVLIQVEKSMTQSIVKALREAEATILKRMQGKSWLVKWKPHDLTKLEAIEGVQHAIPYASLFVVPPSLKETNANENIPLVAVVLHDDARSSSEEVLEKIQGMEGAKVTMSKAGVINVQLSNPDQLKELSELEIVQAIETVTAVAPTNDRIMEITGINRVNGRLKEADLSTLTGEGQVVAVADTGVDSLHDAFNSQGKVLGTWHTKDRADSNDDLGHGTHVAGTILGGPVKNWQDEKITGMAPAARLLVQAVNFEQEASWSSEQLFELAYSAEGGRCRVHNNSWGTPVPKDPDQLRYAVNDAEKVDRWAFSHPDFLIIRSAGNDGKKRTSTNAQVGAYAVSKNVLTVGATFSDRPLDDSEKVDYALAQAVGYQSKQGKVAPSSSRGPVRNTGRTKPDIVAPGAVVLSCRTSSTSPTAVNEMTKWLYRHGQPPEKFKPDDKLIFCSGTSMASPAVSGQALLLREALLKWKNIASPSAPHMKALLINGTDDLGEPRTAQGFGQINLDKVLTPVRQKDADITAGIASSGHAEGVLSDETPPTRWRTIVPTPRRPSGKVSLQITLVYHDAPGEELQNQVNLFVEYSRGRIDTYTDDNRENVHHVSLADLEPAQVITIGVEPVLVAIGNIPWGLAWSHHEV